MQSIGSLVGRILIAAIFLKLGFDKIMNFSNASAGFGAVGLPLPEVFTVLTIAVEILCGIALVVGFQARWAALILFFFYLILITYRYSNAFIYRAQLNDMLLNDMLRNLAIMGGLLMIASFGPGKLAIDKK